MKRRVISNAMSRRRKTMKLQKIRIQNRQRAHFLWLHNDQ